MSETVSSLAAQRSKQAGKKAVGIEDLLAWAYREELPKSSRGVVATAIERDRQILRSCGEDPLGCVRDTATWIDVSPNCYGVIPDLAVDAEPHPDALRIAKAVQAVDAFTIGEVPDMLGEPAFRDLTETERRRAREDGVASATHDNGCLRTKLSTGIIAAAVLGRFRPTPQVDAITRSFVMQRGKPLWFRIVTRSEGEGRPENEVEVDGFDRKRQRPFPGAYRKTVLEPALAPIVAERIDYQAWRWVLDRLTDELDGQLSSFTVGPSTAPWWPWEGSERAQQPRILAAAAKKIN